MEAEAAQPTEVTMSLLIIVADIARKADQGVVHQHLEFPAGLSGSPVEGHKYDEVYE